MRKHRRCRQCATGFRSPLQSPAPAYRRPEPSPSPRLRLRRAQLSLRLCLSARPCGKTTNKDGQNRDVGRGRLFGPCAAPTTTRCTHLARGSDKEARPVSPPASAKTFCGSAVRSSIGSQPLCPTIAGCMSMTHSAIRSPTNTAWSASPGGRPMISACDGSASNPSSASSGS